MINIKTYKCDGPFLQIFRRNGIKMFQNSLHDCIMKIIDGLLQDRGVMEDRFIRGIRIDWDKIEPDSYLRGIPALKGLEELTFNHNITFFVGENGSGKSTLIEGIERRTHHCRFAELELCAARRRARFRPYAYGDGRRYHLQHFRALRRDAFGTDAAQCRHGSDAARYRPCASYSGINGRAA